MTAQLRSLLVGESAICFVGWIVVGILQGSSHLITSSILLSFFVMIMNMKSVKSCVLAFVVSAVLSLLL